MSDGKPAKARRVVFQLDTSIKPVQAHSPERELSRAVLLLAIQDYQAGGAKARKARAFIMSEEVDHLFSFRSICRSFGIDPDAARRAILNRPNIRVGRRRAKFKSELDKAA